MALTADEAKALKQHMTVAVIEQMQPNHLIRIFQKCDELGLIDAEDRAALSNTQLAHSSSDSRLTAPAWSSFSLSRLFRRC